MAPNKRFIREPRLNLAQQRARMIAVWPALDSRIEAGSLVVRGILQPSAITRAYRVKLTYREFGTPKLHIISPKLERRPEAPNVSIPHTYAHATPGEERPCVYYPLSREWTPAMPLATTVLPWLLAWLVDYELWFATGEWFGGGMPHGETKGPNEPRPLAEDAA